MKGTLNFSKIASLLIVSTAALLLSTCDLGTPDDPGRDNPLDIHNPGTHGDPYHLTGELADGGVRLVWHAVPMPGLFGYSLYRCQDAATTFSPLFQAIEDTVFTDQTVQNGHQYRYYVVVRTNTGEGEASAVAKVTVRTDPVLIIEGENVTETPTRNVTLTILAFGAEQMLISNSSDFAGAVWEPYATTKAWQLTTGEGTKKVYGRVAFAGDTSDVVEDEIEPAGLRPSLAILPDSLYINHPDVTLSMPNTGALEMKIADNPDGIGVSWQAYQSQIDWDLSEGDGWKKVYTWFRNEFYSVGTVLDSVGLDTHAEIEYCDWVSDGGDTLGPGDQVVFRMQLAKDALGIERSGIGSAMVEGWAPQRKSIDKEGHFMATYLISNLTKKVLNVPVYFSFTDQLGNFAETRIGVLRLNANWNSPTEEREFRLGNSDQKITMCWIPPGNFLMGRQPLEQDSQENEDPRHLVTFTRGFWISKFEVTQKQWEAVTGNNPSFFRGNDLPVEQVNWIDIQLFELQLNDSFRLPSEAEWEYACRGGTSTRFYWGNDSDYTQIISYAWQEENSAQSTHTVGGKKINPWGLCDMAGNVMEWCEDQAHYDYNGAPTDGRAWNGGGEGHPLRGGSWDTANSVSRSSHRVFASTTYATNYFGFRLVRDRD